MEKGFGCSIRVSQYRDYQTERMDAANINWPGTHLNGVSIAKAEEFHKELGKAIRFAKAANIRAGKKVR